MASKAYKAVLDAIPGKKVRKGKNAHMALCPVHNDKNPSLKIEEGSDGKVMVHCFAGCTKDGPQSVLNKIGLKMSDLFEDDVSSNGHGSSTPSKSRVIEYETRDIEGSLVATHYRMDTPKGKRVWWKMPDGSKPSDAGVSPADFPLYGTQKLATAPNRVPVVVVEGEKACDALQGILGSLVTVLGTTTGADSTPSRESLSVLENKDVILWPDKDTPGRIHMRKVAERLVEIAREVRIYKHRNIESGGDAADIKVRTEAEKDDLLNDLVTAKEYIPKPSTTKEPQSFGVYAQQHVKLVSARVSGDGITGIRTGVKAVDVGLEGLNDGLTYVIGAITGGAKSLVGGEFALYPAWTQDKNVLLVSTEQAGIIYYDRFVHVMADVPYSRGRKGNLTDQEQTKLARAGRELDSLPLTIAVGTYTVSEIREMAEDLDVDMVVIDYVQAVSPSDRKMAKWEQVATISGDIRQLKTDMDVPFILTAQAGRAAANRDSKRPQIWDLAYSSEIERDADAIMLLHNAHRMGEEGAIPGQLKIYCDKFREGYPWKATVRFREGQNWIEDIPSHRSAKETLYDDELGDDDA